MRYTLWIIVFLFLAGAFLFYVLGGFAPVEIENKQVAALKLMGYQYKGTPQNEKLTEIFRTIEAHKQLHPEANLYTIYEVEPAGKSDTLVVFVGLDVEFPDQAGIQTREFAEGPAIVASIQAHRFVMPSPAKVKQYIQEFAVENQLPSPTVFVDKIISHREIQVIAYTAP
jgi:hypothetical protein